MSDQPKVHEALVNVMEELQSIGKQTSQGVSYSFRGVDSVLNAVGPLLRKHRVLCLPEHLSTEFRDVTTKNGAVMRETRVRVKYHFIGPAGDELCATVEGEAADTSDKSTAQAFSVAYRICLLQSFTVPTHSDDPDGKTFDRSAPPDDRLSESERKKLIDSIKKSSPEVQEVAKAWLAEHQRVLTKVGITEAEAFELEAALDAKEALSPEGDGQ
jgi:hypothetical protein